MLKSIRILSPLDAAVIVAFILTPWYIFPSGLPQPADIFFICVISLVSFFSLIRTRKHTLTRRENLVVTVFFVFVLWAFFITAVHSLINSYAPILINALFYFFNFIVFVFIFFYFKRNIQAERYWVLEFLLFITSVSLLVSIFYNFNTGALRQTAGFNNPNQLGYYSLLLLSLVILSTPSDRGFRFFCLFSFVVCLLGVALSSSLSAIISASFVILAIGFKFSLWRPRNLIAFVVLFILCGVAYLSFSNFDGVMHALEQLTVRFEMFDSKTEDIVGTRGYERIFEYPEYLIFGAAEGARFRFGLAHQLEMHSTIGTVLFSYGVVGLVLFLVVLLLILYKQPTYIWMIFAGVMVYSLTHQGLRTTFFWILLALILALASARKDVVKFN